MQKIDSKKINASLKTIRVLCGPTRFKIICLLSQNSDGLNVTELARILNSSLSRVSHQLKILKKHKLIVGAGKNRETIYKLADHRLRKYLHIILKRS